jgi:hypothetical protein
LGLLASAADHGISFDYSEFSKERIRVEVFVEFRNTRYRQRIEREMTGYMDWIWKTEDMLLVDPLLPQHDRDGIKEC